MKRVIHFIDRILCLLFLMVPFPTIFVSQTNEELSITGSIAQYEQESRPITFQQRILPQKPDRTILKSIDDPRHIEVKFIDGLHIDINTAGVPTERNGKGLRTFAAINIFETISHSGGKWRRMAGASIGEIDRLRRNAQTNLNRAIANLNNYFILSVPSGVTTEEWINQLNALPDVELALPLPLPTSLPQPGNYQARQGYLNVATTGIGASYAWSIGDSGQNVAICDLEYSWNLSHSDLPAGITKLVPPGYTDSDPKLDDNHGTAVLGELVSLNNGTGTTGACYGATVKVAPTYLNGAWQLGTAMLYAISNLTRGDIILIEQQYDGPRNTNPLSDTGKIPIEWYPSWYQVVLTAIGNGIHVVEAAGNGYQDLDSAVYSTGNYGHWPFLPQNNSGAIIVGAGAVPPGAYPGGFYGSDIARSRLPFSNYGSRLNLQGWGEKVVTTGYGYYYSASGVDFYYDSSFAGTSSASPIVASAVALVESRYEALNSRPLPPLSMRTILTSTGSAQQAGTYPTSQNIGPLPDVQTALGYNFNSLLFAGGTYSVGSSYTFKKLTQVADTLNRKILTGNVIFELQSDYDGTTGETFPIIFNEYQTQGGNWTVTIRPASGVTYRITDGLTSGLQSLIMLNGTDRMTFDGRAGGVGSTIAWTISNGNSSYPGPTIHLGSDATNNVLQYLEIEGQTTSLYYGTIYFGEYSFSQGNSHNVISNCNIHDRSDGLGTPHAIAIYSDWTTGAPNDSNTIQNCNIYNWTSYGMKLYGQKWNIISNSLYQTSTQMSQLMGIYFLPSTFQKSGGHFVSGNFIGGTAPSAGGTPLLDASGTNFTGIQINIDTAMANTIQNNVIRNIFLVTPAFSGFTGIDFNGNPLSPNLSGTITGNLIGDTAVSNKIQISGMGMVEGIKINSPGTVTVSQNVITNIEQTHPIPGEFRGIDVICGYSYILRNYIFNVGSSNIGASNFVRGIFLDNQNDTVNVVNNMISLGVGLTTKCQYEGIHDQITFGNLVHNSLFNSVYIGGTSNSTDSSYCFRRTGVSFVNIKDNIFYNGRTGGTGFHVALSNAGQLVGWFAGSSDKNILFNANNAQLTQWLTMYQNLPTWRGITGCDFSSYNADPQFINPSANDLHIDPSVYSYADNNGLSMTGINDDFDGNPRNPSPDIGADEYTINAPSAFTQISPSNGSSSQPVNGTLTWRASAAVGQYLVYLDTLNPPSFVVSQTDTNYSYSGLDTNKRYYWQIHAVNSSGNIQATGSPWSFFIGAGTGQVTKSYSIMDGWNMISVPLLVDDPRKGTLYQNAISYAFGYDGTYTLVDSLKNGIGYWLKFDGAQSVDITGFEFEKDTIDVINRWNMIGCPTQFVPVDSISSIPGGIVTTNFFGYDGSSYKKADTLRPGYGYWVKVNQNGQLILKNFSSVMMLNRIKIQPTSEMPPLPPNSEIHNPQFAIPKEFALEQNYPNPFNPSTTIKWQIPKAAFVTLKIYDLLGKEIKTLVNEAQVNGIYQAVWIGDNNSGKKVSSGIYFYQLRSGDFVETKKMLLIK